MQNATLAGGVAVGAAANLNIHLWGAMLVGTIAGIISTLGFQFLSVRSTNFTSDHLLLVHTYFTREGYHTHSISSIICQSNVQANQFNTCY